MINRAGSWLPRGSSRSTSSARVTTAKLAIGLRLIVSKQKTPPGFSTRAISAMTRERSATCSSTSTQTTASKHSSAYGSASPTPLS